MFLDYDPISRLHWPIKTRQPKVDIPTEDEIAYEFYKDYSWIYYKDHFLDSYSRTIERIDFGRLPKAYPAVVKPRINLGGGGIDFYKIENPEQLLEIMSSNFICMEFLLGPHISHDFIVVKGKVQTCFSFLGHTVGDGTFDYWESIQIPRKINSKLSRWIGEFLSNYTGIVNIETIGGKPIEAQLRMGDIDKYADVDLMEAIMQLYEDGVWNFKKRLPKLYVFALFRKHDIPYSITNPDGILAETICWQVDNPEYYWQNPPSGVRLAVFSTTDYQKGLRIRNKLASFCNYEPIFKG